MIGALVIFIVFVAIMSGSGMAAGVAAFFAMLYLLLIHDDVAGTSLDKRNRRR